MANGAVKPIEQVKIGDFVMSRDPRTGITTAKQVTQTSAHTADATLTLTFGNGEAIQTTSTHPFYVPGRGFVQASQLGIGTSIVTRAGPAATLTAKTNHTGSLRVYNFEVADFHTYFVGKSDGGLWVHNSGCDLVIDLAKQGKHILGHNNYRVGRSILTADAQSLLGFAGSGTPVGAVARGLAGFKERVNFGYVIGKYVDRATGALVDTTNGIIHYAKTGVHIVPSAP